MSATITEQELANHTHVGSGEVEQENAPAKTEQTAAASGKRKSTAVNLIGTRYEEFVTDGRFRPGYDAKAKSQMIQDALSDNAELVTEAERVLGVMSWTSHLETKKQTLASKANKPSPAAGEKRPLTGAAKAAAERKAAKASGTPASESGTPVGGAQQQTAPDENNIWLRSTRRGIFVMQGETPLQKFDPTEQTNAIELAQSTYDAAIANGQTVTLNLEIQGAE